MMGYIRAAFRLGCTFVWTVLIVLGSLVTLLGPHGLRRRLRWEQRWARGLLRIWGIRVHTYGTPPPPAPAAILVSNHLSYVDIPLIVAHLPTVFVAKAEIRGWPIIGWLSRYTGNLFIERHPAQVLRQIRNIRQTVERGIWVTFFPEGGITDRDGVRTFRVGLFALARQARILVYPMVIRYRPWHLLYWGPVAMPRHLWRWLQQPYVIADVVWLPPVDLSDVEISDLRQRVRQIHEMMHRAYTDLQRRDTPGAPTAPDAPMPVSVSGAQE